MPLDEADSPELSPDEHKGSRTNRWKEKLSKTRSKFTKHNDKPSEDFKLPDDVNDFLAAGRSSTSSSTDRSPNALPLHPAPPRRREVPRIDFAHAQRFPQQREIVQEESKAYLTPKKHDRSTSPAITGRKRFRARNLSVGFVDTAPVIIGEGGDDAETPTIEISKPRPQSALTGSLRDDPRKLSNSRSPIQRKPVPEASARPDGPEQDFVPRLLARVPTGGTHLTPAGGLDAANREFEMSLQFTPPTERPEVQMPAPIRPAPLPPESTFTPRTEGAPPSSLLSTASNPKAGLKPAVGHVDLRTQFAEGKALREAHYRNLSNSSFIEANSPTQSHMPPLQDLRLQNSANDTGIFKDNLTPSTADSNPKKYAPGGWI